MRNVKPSESHFGFAEKFNNESEHAVCQRVYRVYLSTVRFVTDFFSQKDIQYHIEHNFSGARWPPHPIRSGNDGTQTAVRQDAIESGTQQRCDGTDREYIEHIGCVTLCNFCESIVDDR